MPVPDAQLRERHDLLTLEYSKLRGELNKEKDLLKAALAEQAEMNKRVNVMRSAISQLARMAYGGGRGFPNRMGRRGWKKC